MPNTTIDYQLLASKIKHWGSALGFSQVGICEVDLTNHEQYLNEWLRNQYHGDMTYMSRHGTKRSHPAELVPGTLRVISVRLDYLPEHAGFARTLESQNQAYISRYALGRDYHKLMRKRLQQLGKQIAEYCADINYRPFVDSAPVLERPLAAKAGLGWVGKHSLLISSQAGSWFFLGELFVDIPLPLSTADNIEKSQCKECVACMNICPTRAIVEPYVVDARRCISYLTIESKAAIPVEFRPLIGNRIYGCDDCQLVCPWNKYARLTLEDNFQPRNNLDQISLLELFNWSDKEFLSRFEGSAIRRIGFERWQRNIAVALGNAPSNDEIIALLDKKLSTASEMVTEHINWAIDQQIEKKNTLCPDSDPLSDNQQLKRLLRCIKKNSPRDA